MKMTKNAVAVIFLFFVAGLLPAHAQLNLRMLIIGGGGGGGSNAGTNSSGGGGGGGGQVQYATTTAGAGSVLTVSVGAGGNGFRYLVTPETNGGSSSVVLGLNSWSASGGNEGGSAISAAVSGAGGTSENSDGSGAGGRGGIYNNGNTTSGWPVSGGNGTAAYSSWGAATSTGQLSGGVYYYGGGGAGGNWGGQLGSGVAAAGLGGAGLSNSDATANTGGGGGGANSNGHSGFDLPGGNGGSGLVVISYAGTPLATGGTITQSGGYTYHTFTAGGVLSLNTILPMVWETFTAVRANGVVTLDWSVSKNLEAVDYDVERSANGSAFEQISSIKGGPSGQYFYQDIHPLNTQTWYRIKQVDAAGQVSYSHVEVVGTGALPIVQFYPNPIRDRVCINLPAGNVAGYSCTVYNEAGSVVLKQALSPGLNEMDMHSMEAGLYIVALWKDGVSVLVQQMLK